MKKLALVVDTNVLIDFRTQPKDGAAREFMTFALCHSDEIRLGAAAHSLKDVFCIVERDLKRQSAISGAFDPEAAGIAARRSAWATIEQLTGSIEVVGSDYMDALLAAKYRGLHDYYEDNLVIAACRRMKADALVTSDQALLKHAPVLALTPADALKWLRTELD